MKVKARTKERSVRMAETWNQERPNGCPNLPDKESHIERGESMKMSRAQIARGISELCRNPLCGSPVPPSTRRLRLYCSYRCRQNHSILGRAAKMLLPLGSAGAWGMLLQLENRGSKDKASIEIVDPEPI